MTPKTHTQPSKTPDTQRVRMPLLHHVSIKTRDVQAIIDWYKLVIGSRVMFRFDGGAFISNDEANHRMAIFTAPSLVDDDARLTRTGLHHVGYEYPSLDDLLATYVRLKAEGVLPSACLDHGQATSFYYFDPDGNGVELQVDNFGSWEKSSDFILRDPRFLADPIGTPVNPDLMVAARDQGMSPDEIHERAYRGEMPPAATHDLRLPD
jgi:catechol-2,3-dioxygenase